MSETKPRRESVKRKPSGAASSFGGPRSSRGMKRRKKASIASRPSGGREIAARRLAAGLRDDERAAASS